MAFNLKTLKLKNIVEAAVITGFTALGVADIAGAFDPVETPKTERNFGSGSGNASGEASASSASSNATSPISKGEVIEKILAMPVPARPMPSGSGSGSGSGSSSSSANVKTSKALIKSWLCVSQDPFARINNDPGCKPRAEELQRMERERAERLRLGEIAYEKARIKESFLPRGLDIQDNGFIVDENGSVDVSPDCVMEVIEKTIDQRGIPHPAIKVCGP